VLEAKVVAIRWAGQSGIHLSAWHSNWWNTRMGSLIALVQPPPRESLHLIRPPPKLLIPVGAPEGFERNSLPDLLPGRDFGSRLLFLLGWALRSSPVACGLAYGSQGLHQPLGRSSLRLSHTLLTTVAQHSKMVEWDWYRVPNGWQIEGVTEPSERIYIVIKSQGNWKPLGVSPMSFHVVSAERKPVYLKREDTAADADKGNGQHDHRGQGLVRRIVAWGSVALGRPCPPL